MGRPAQFLRYQVSSDCLRECSHCSLAEDSTCSTLGLLIPHSTAMVVRRKELQKGILCILL